MSACLGARPLLLVAALATPAVLPAQAGSVSDSASEAHRALLIDVGDAVDQVSARSSDFRRDLPTVGAQTVVARGERLVQACRDAQTVVRADRPKLASAKLEPYQVADRDSVLVAMDRLTRGLEQECIRGLPQTGAAWHADSLRAWGPYRTARLSQDIGLYHSAAARLARRLGIDLTHRE